MKKIIFFLICLSAHFAFSGVNKIASIQLEAGPWDRLQTPVSIPIDGFAYSVDAGQLYLLDREYQPRQPLAAQYVAGEHPRLNWVLPQAKAGEHKSFDVILSNTPPVQTPLAVVADEQKILLQRNGKSLLQYNTVVVYPPEGVDDVYKRSGFIHPLWSPKGAVLTRIQPPDHFHHYGLWGPWTKTQIDGREVDFWNLGKGQGTVRFAGLLSVLKGGVFSGFTVRQEHIDFGAAGGDKVAINETMTVRAWNTAFASGAWLMDYTITLNCPADSVLLEAYRYGGGIGFRAAESWTNENVRVLTSEGKTRKDADGTNARWCDVSGENDMGARSGILFMSHPNNRKYPEPMRVWPENANNGRGDFFFEFCPIRHESWALRPGRDYVLRYRLLIYDDQLDAQVAERAWQDFAHPPVAKIISMTE